MHKRSPLNTAKRIHDKQEEKRVDQVNIMKKKANKKRTKRNPTEIKIFALSIQIGIVFVLLSILGSYEANAIWMYMTTGKMHWTGYVTLVILLVFCTWIYKLADKIFELPRK